ncbi:MAG: DNA-processing protein DprA [Patescibacteria group bacterium]
MNTLTIDDEQYPALLREIAVAPKRLYYRGSLDFPKERILAVVGTRRMTSLGKRACEMIVPPLARAGYTIVSGLCYGLDTLAHRLTLEHGGITVGVIASGLDDESIYPQENRGLIERMIEQGGCVFSEYPPGTRPQKYFFPQRNRIVAGMSHGVLVVEAPERSGALITAFRALNENREVFAVPGPITHETFGGTNLLLKLGAHVVTESADVFHVFGDDVDTEKEHPSIKNLTSEEQKIIDCVRDDEMHLDHIAERTQLDIRVVHSTLGILELKGLIYSAGNGCYIKK